MPFFGLAGGFFGRSDMGSLELLSYFWSLNTVLLVKIANFDFGGLTYPPIPKGRDGKL